MKPSVVKPKFNKTIHFIYGLWDLTPIPEYYLNNITEWKRLNPDWAVKIWDRSMLQQLWEQHMSIVWKDAFLHPVQYADLGRCLIVWKEGGVYSDLDVYPKHSLDTLDLQQTQTCWLGIETPVKINHIKCELSDIDSTPYVKIVLQDQRGANINNRSQPGPHLPSIRNGVPERLPRLANYWFMSTARHPWLLEVIKLQLSRRHLPIHREYDIIYTTGPDIFSTTLTNWSTNNWNGKILEFSRKNGQLPSATVKVLTHPMMKQYFQHQCSGSWRWVRNRYIMVV